jgi:hypothetical protein
MCNWTNSILDWKRRNLLDSGDRARLLYWLPRYWRLADTAAGYHRKSIGAAHGRCASFS